MWYNKFNMVYTVSITSQGQISIPAKFRRELGLNKHKKALIKKEGDKLVVEPVPDILSLKGSLKHKAKKGMSIEKIMELEGKAWENAAVERYVHSIKR